MRLAALPHFDLELRCSPSMNQMLLCANCKGSCVLTSESWISTDVVRHPRHDSSLSVCVASISRNSCPAVTSFASRRRGVRLWASKTDEGYLLQPILSALSGDQDSVVDYYKRDPLQSKFLLDDFMVDNGNCFGRQSSFDMLEDSGDFSKCYQPVEEPWLFESSLLLDKYTADDSILLSDLAEGDDETSEFMIGDLGSRMRSENISFNVDSHDMASYYDTWSSAEREQPVEEPWFLCASVASQETGVGSSLTLGTRTSKDALSDEKIDEEHLEQHRDESRDLLSTEDSVSTEILINSSICTMQRIAVLEEGNLVEILLEPVKNNVQCDSVYVGVVTKLVPHMGGAFVNIGNQRPSLMDINHYREPFIFPPFAQSMKGKASDDSLLTSHSEQLNGSHNEESGLDHIQTSSVENGSTFVKDSSGYERDDFEDHEGEDDFDDEEGHARNFLEENDATRDSIIDVNGNGIYLKDQIDPLIDHGSDSGFKPNWAFVRKGTKVVVQVVKEGLGSKGPTLTAYPKLRSRFWVLKTRSNNVGISKKISGVERTRLRVIAKSLRPAGFGLTVRTVAAGHPLQELRKDLEGLLSTWRNIMDHAKSAALAADEGVEGAVPVILHQAMSQTLSVVQDYFTANVKRMKVDSPRTFHEVTNYLQDIAPDLCDRVELHNKKVPLFDEYNVEEEINNILNKRVPLPKGGSLVIEQTEALVSIDVNGGHGMFGQGTSQEKAVLDVNLAAAKQIARELRLRDIGGIIVVDFIDMHDDANKRLVYEEVKKAVERDRSMVKVSELSKHGLMEITRKRVRPSVTFMVSEPCICCHGTGRVEALETSFSKIEREICRLLASMEEKADPENPKSWPRLILRVDSDMCEYLTAGKKTRLATLSSSLKVWIILKVELQKVGILQGLSLASLELGVSLATTSLSLGTGVARNLTRGAFEVKPLTDERHQVAPLVARPPEAGSSSGFSRRTKLLSVKKWKTRGKLSPPS